MQGQIDVGNCTQFGITKGRAVCQREGEKSFHVNT